MRSVAATSLVGFGAAGSAVRRTFSSRNSIHHNPLTISAFTHQCRSSSILHIPTLLEHHCALNVFPGAVTKEQPGTQSASYCAPKLIATIGPSCNSVSMLKDFIRCGMSVARLNFSHGTHEYHRETISRIRQAAAEMCKPVAIALDTKGAEIRTGSFVDCKTSVAMTLGSEVVVTVDPQHAEACTPSLLFIDYQPLATEARPGSRILIADGTVELTVAAIRGAESASPSLVCTVTGPGELSGRNNVHLPGIDVNLPAISARDHADIVFGLKHGIDMIFASFVRSRDHVDEIRSLVQQFDREQAALISDSRAELLPAEGLTPNRCRVRTDVAIVSKIENHRGLHNIDEIIDASDGVMVARGDLGVEIPVEHVFLAQKMMIAKCNAAAKPVICATQMLESMKHSPRPTRAEASDVANAVIDGADGVMLSAETASGKYPVEALTVLRRVAHQGYLYIRHGKRFVEMLSSDIGTVRSSPPQPAVYNPSVAAASGQVVAIHDSVASSAVLTAFEINATCIITTTVSTRSVRLLSKYNPRCPIIAVCHSLAAYMKLTIVSGVVGVYLPALRGRHSHRSSVDSKYIETDHLTIDEWTDRFDEWVDIALDALKDGLLELDGLTPELVRQGSKLIVTCTDDRRGFRGVRGMLTIRQM